MIFLSFLVRNLLDCFSPSLSLSVRMCLCACACASFLLRSHSLYLELASPLTTQYVQTDKTNAAAIRTPVGEEGGGEVE